MAGIPAILQSVLFRCPLGSYRTERSAGRSWIVLSHKKPDSNPLYEASAESLVAWNPARYFSVRADVEKASDSGGGGAGRMKQIRVEARIRNNLLWHRIFDEYKNVSAFCKHNAYNQAGIGRLLNLKEYPHGPKGWRLAARRLCEQFKMLPEDLFPEQLYGVKETKAVVEVSIAELPGLRYRGLLPEKILYKKEIERTVHEVLEKLKPRESYVLQQRSEGQTYREIGEELELTRERIKQIEARGHRRIRENNAMNRKLAGAYEMMQEVEA